MNLETVEEYRARKVEFEAAQGMLLRDSTWDYLNSKFSVAELRLRPYRDKTPLAAAFPWIVQAFEAGWTAGWDESQDECWEERELNDPNLC